MRVPGRTPPGTGNGTIANSELRFARYRITSSTPFNAQTVNIYWKNSGANPVTIVTAYINGINTDITNSTNNINHLADLLLPVDLSAFTARAVDKCVELKWQTKTEVNNSGFNVERKINEVDRKTLGFVECHGTTTELKKNTAKN